MHVGFGGSQFCEPTLERMYSAHASQQNVVTLEFGSPCSPASALFAHDLNRGLQRLPRSITKCSVSNVESFASMTRTCLTTIWHIFCVCFNNGLPRSITKCFVSNVECASMTRTCPTWNTISWKCSMENDGVRSSLIELQSIPHSKIDVDPISVF